MDSEQVAVKTIEFNCAVGIVLNLMRNGIITTEEFDSVNP